ncbi:MAG: hypothetical protein JKY37_31445 [Nannocystaceae bacterium]|nr:hypothetical protein [Nannocystaceae bacterium]
MYQPITVRFDGPIDVSHIDIENFAEGDDIWGDGVVRLDPPLRTMVTQDVWGNPLPGPSGAIFPFAIPEGQHGFPLPGQMTDWAVQLCKETNGSGAPECNADRIEGQVFDIGWYMFHVMGAYFKGDTTIFDRDCIARLSCGSPDYPERRELDTLH